MKNGFGNEFLNHISKTEYIKTIFYCTHHGKECLLFQKFQKQENKEKTFSVLHFYFQNLGTFTGKPEKQLRAHRFLKRKFGHCPRTAGFVQICS